MDSRDPPSRSEALDTDRARGREKRNWEGASTEQSSQPDPADEQTGVGRRKFIVGMFGASGLVGASVGGAVFLVDSQTDRGPETIAEEFLEELGNRDFQEASRLLHSHSPWSDPRAALEALDPVDGVKQLDRTTVTATGVSTATFAEHTSLGSGTAERITSGAETAVVEAVYGPAVASPARQSVVRLALATEDGDWRIVRNEADGEAARPIPDQDTSRADDRIPKTVHEYLLKNEVRGYDGTLTDRTGRDSVTVLVGAGDNGFQFEPPVVLVDEGTEIVWEWTSEGSIDNVIVHKGPVRFKSDMTVAEAGHTFSQTLTELGNYIYYSGIHKQLGMHGAIVVR